MKKRVLWFLWSMLILFASIAVVPVTFADCQFGFWSNCFVDGINTIWTEKNQESRLLDTIKNTINRVLWILATIALVICLYAGFKMLTSWWDSKWYESWVKILKNAALWLVIIWLSRLIVSAILWFIDVQTEWNNVIQK